MGEDIERTLVDCAHDYCIGLKRFENTAKKCSFKKENDCTKIPGSWRCSILNCPYCSYVLTMYREEMKNSD